MNHEGNGMTLVKMNAVKQRGFSPYSVSLMVQGGYLTEYSPADVTPQLFIWK